MTAYARALGVALAQTTYDTHESRERAVLKELLSTLELDGALIQADALHPTQPLFDGAWSRGPTSLTVKANQQNVYRQIGYQFQGKRKIPHAATAHEKKHGRDTVWDLRAKEAPEHIKANGPGSAWIVDVIIDTVTRSAKRSIRRHLGGVTKRTSRCDTSLRTSPDALLRRIRQRWSMENAWHGTRDAQLGADAHRHANRTGAPVFTLLRTIVRNLLRRGGNRSIPPRAPRVGRRQQADAGAWRCCATAEHGLRTLLGSPGVLGISRVF